MKTPKLQEKTAFDKKYRPCPPKCFRGEIGERQRSPTPSDTMQSMCTCSPEKKQSERASKWETEREFQPPSCITNGYKENSVLCFFLCFFLMTWKDIHQKMTWKDIHQSYFTCKIKQIINEIICSKNEWHRRWSHCLIIILFQTQSMDSNVSWSLTKWDCSTV